MIKRDFAFYTNVGGRKKNEDSYLIEQIEDADLFIVADGLGGLGDGEIASRTAGNAVREYLMTNQNADILKAIEFANERVLKKQQQMMSKMKTTIALAYIRGNETIIAHVGDTRVYAFCKGKIVFQTIDHSASQQAVFSGEISKDDIRNHSKRNVLTRALGVLEKVNADVTVLPNSQYDALLICSDGFWEYVFEDEMIEMLCKTESANEWLYELRNVQLERVPNNCDNNTAIALVI